VHELFKTNLALIVAEGFDANVRRVEVLGDLTSAEAFVYVCGGKVENRKGKEEDWPGLVAQSEGTKKLGEMKMTPEDWKKVWLVCGGNIHLLRNCVDYARQYNSWEKGKKTVSSVLLFFCYQIINLSMFLLVIDCLQA
jgi:hypothetical protein